MTVLEVPKQDEEVLLSRDELHLLRFTCELSAEDESPLGPVQALEDERVLELAAHSLIGRGLIDRATLRPHREVVRRLLVVSQPDARVVMMRSEGQGARREIDLYERAGAYVPYRRRSGQHALGKARESSEVLEEVLAMLAVRRSFGDFIDFNLTPTEYFAFALLAGELVARKGSDLISHERATVKSLTAGHEVPLSHPASDEGTPIHRMLGQLPAEVGRSHPGREDWNAAIESLVEKELIVRAGGGYQLRPFLHDLAEGLALRHRVVLTRFDFGAEDWIVRDATMIPVPGSLFLVRALREGGIRIVELTRDALTQAVRATVAPARR
jgi:hypothetical protein